MILKETIRWFSGSIFSIYLRKSINFILSQVNGIVVFYDEPERVKIMNLVKKVKKENETLLRYNEAYQIYMGVDRTKKIKGDIAEVGTYKGGSSKLICKAKGNKVLHLFDTFEGLPEINNNIDDKKQFFKGQFPASLESVKKYLKKYKNVYFYKGIFPDETSKSIKNKTFSFVHLDLDLYEATARSIEFFYPRMNPGAIMISHDYTNSPGVKKAFDDFFKNKKEPIIEMSGTQCLIVKI